MSSGKKERILITCSTFEVAKIIEPAKFYDVTKVHIVHYDHKDVYLQFYYEVERRLKQWKPDIVIEEHKDEPVYDFTKMMNTIMTIISKERDPEDMPDIYVNISSGTHEFTAAAVIASMMWDNTMAFTVPTAEYKVKDEDVVKVYYDDDEVTPIGLSKTVKDPMKFSGYSIPKPEKKLVLGLGILKARLDNREKISAPNMIEALASKGLIDPTYVDNNKERGKYDQKCIMNYQRNFVDKWMDLGWIDRISKRELEITKEGEQILKTFLECYQKSKC